MSAKSEGLVLTNVRAGYGETVVIDDVSLSLAPGATLALLGRNGVGKTTLFSTIMGHTTMHGGSIRFNGEEISKLPPYRRALMGLALVPQEREIFKSLTVEENLVVAERAGRWSLQRVYEFFPSLARRRKNRGDQLSGGEQQMLAIGRALMTNPLLLILDEATEGLAPLIRAEIWSCLAGLKANGQAILVVDKNLTALARLADRHYVIEKGRVAWSGTSAALIAERRAIEQRIGV